MTHQIELIFTENWDVTVIPVSLQIESIFSVLVWQNRHRRFQMETDRISNLKPFFIMRNSAITILYWDPGESSTHPNNDARVRGFGTRGSGRHAIRRTFGALAHQDWRSHPLEFSETHILSPSIRSGQLLSNSDWNSAVWNKISWIDYGNWWCRSMFAPFRCTIL